MTKLFSPLYGNRNFLTVFTRLLHWSLSLQPRKPSNNITCHLSRISFNNIPTSMLCSPSGSSREVFQLKFPKHNIFRKRSDLFNLSRSSWYFYENITRMSTFVLLLSWQQKNRQCVRYKHETFLPIYQFTWTRCSQVRNIYIYGSCKKCCCCSVILKLQNSAKAIRMKVWPTVNILINV